jgi:hypothetical protein
MSGGVVYQVRQAIQPCTIIARDSIINRPHPEEAA